MAESPIGTFRAFLAAALALLAALAILAPTATGHGDAIAHAVKPATKGDPLRLVGVGRYGTDRAHAGGVRVTVCLARRSSGSFVAVRCNTKSVPGARVRARVSVPGCVRGVWRTVVYGQAQNAAGEWRHGKVDASPRFRCP
jgi:hypothetical protein